MKRKPIVILSALILALGVWLLINPPGRFGFCMFGCLTYSSVPRPLSDLQVRSDGKTRSVSKTHSLTLDQVRWLLEPRPKILIIGTGWDGVVEPSKELQTLPECDVRILKTGDAVQLYNALKRAGQKVAIHVHSTC